MTKDELPWFESQSIAIVAHRVEILEFEWKTRSELTNAIRSASAETADCLDRFLTSYAEWVLASEDGTNDLMEKMEARDRTRNELIRHLDLKFPRRS